MSWYKKSQQGLLFYPWEQAPKKTTLMPTPIGKNELGQELLLCGKCGEQLTPEEVNWFEDISFKEQEFSVPFNQEDIKNGLMEIHNYLLPFYNKFLEFKKSMEGEGALRSGFSSYDQWEVMVQQLPDIINKHPALSDAAAYSSRESYLDNPVFRLVKDAPFEINGSDLSNLINLFEDPNKTINSILEQHISNEPFKIPEKAPLCFECYEEFSKCYFCNKPIGPKDRKIPLSWDDEEMVCWECIENGNAETCSDCGKADSLQDMTPEGEYGGYFCNSCRGARQDMAIEWAENVIQTLNIPIGKNLPIDEKTLNNAKMFLTNYLKKYKDNHLDGKETNKLFYIANKARVSESTIDYLGTMIKLENSPKVSSILEDIENNLEAKKYMKERYPDIKYKDFPYKIEVDTNYNASYNAVGFTLTIQPEEMFFNYLGEKFPESDVKKVWDNMTSRGHHHDALAYARCGYVGGNNLVINNLQRDADADNLKGTYRSNKEDLAIAKTIEKMTDNWDTFLIDVIRSMCISKDIDGFLTTFDNQRKKWSNLPIHKSKKTYQDVPEGMGFEEVYPDYEVEGVTESYGNYYQVANLGVNWFKRAQLNEPLKWEFPEADHDYDPSWSYEVVIPDQELMTIAENTINEINTKMMPEIGMGKAKAAYITTDEDVLAKYAFGTAPYPVFVIDLNRIKEVATECANDLMCDVETEIHIGIRTTLFHELGHAIQDWMNMNLDEDQAERFAREYQDFGDIWVFWD